MEVQKLMITKEKSIKDALIQLNEIGLELLFVVDEFSRIVGILTDGDVRRALLKSSTLETEIQFAMNKNFVALPFKSDNSTILNTLNDSIKIIPLIDENKKLIDFATLGKIRRIPVAQPVLSGNELAYVADCIKTNWISSQGKYVYEFEKKFSDYHRSHPALAVSNGTVALHLALVTLGITQGDEVLVPNFTFAASINAILYTGATPVLIDVEKETWNIDPIKIIEKITPKSKAIMPVHIYGHPCEMDAIMDIASTYNLKIIEDCAEALGSHYKGLPVGCFGDAAAFSFFGNKTITTGEGGMVLFKNKSDAEKASILRDHGMQKDKRYWHETIGFNYRITNIQAAIGVAQMEQLESFIDAKRNNAQSYNRALSSIEFINTPIEKSNCLNTYWLYTIMIEESCPFNRVELIEFLSLNGVETRPVFFPINTMPPYQNFGKASDLEISTLISNNAISLPSSTNLKEDEIDYITSLIKKFLERYKAI